MALCRLTQTCRTIAFVPASALSSRTQCRSIFGWLLSGKTRKEYNAEKKEHRKFLREELRKGYFGDYMDFGENKGKEFIGALTPISSKKADKFVPMDVVNFNGQSVQIEQLLKGKISLVLVACSTTGLEMMAGYTEPFFRDFGKLSDFVQMFQVIGSTRFFYRRILFPVFHKRTIAALPSEQRPGYLEFRGPMYTVRRKLGVVNSIVPYVYVVDQHGYIRWKAVSEPTAMELEAMQGVLVDLTKDLMEEKKKKKERHKMVNEPSNTVFKGVK